MGFGPKNGVQTTSSSSRGDSSSPSSSGKTLSMFGWCTPASVESWTTNPSSSSNRSILTSGVSDILSLLVTLLLIQINEMLLEPQTCKHLKSTHCFSEVHEKCNLHKPLKKASLWPPRCPAEIYAQKQCLHFFTILLTAMSERWLYLRWKSSQTRDWWTQSFQST